MSIHELREAEARARDAIAKLERMDELLLGCAVVEFTDTKSRIKFVFKDWSNNSRSLYEARIYAGSIEYLVRPKRGATTFLT